MPKTTEHSRDLLLLLFLARASVNSHLRKFQCVTSYYTPISAWANFQSVRICVRTMSWNPFKKTKPSLKQSRSKIRRRYSTLWGDREFEKEVSSFIQLEGATKKIYKETKKYGDALSALSKAELRIYQDLASSPLSHGESLKEPLTECTACAERLEELRQELATRNQKTVTDPMKKFSGVFPSVNAAIKRRDQALQDYQKYQAKVQKLQEREKTPQNQAKLDANNQALAAAKLDYERQNALMLEDLPQLIEGRLDYFEPSFEALIRSQASYYSQASQVLSDLTNTLGWKNSELSDEEHQQELQQKLAEIRSLSIVEDG